MTPPAPLISFGLSVCVINDIYRKAHNFVRYQFLLQKPQLLTVQHLPFENTFLKFRFTLITFQSILYDVYVTQEQITLVSKILTGKTRTSTHVISVPLFFSDSLAGGVKFVSCRGQIVFVMLAEGQK